MNMLKALGHTPPVYAHVPMILGADGARLSKRHGAVSVMQYRDEGYLPEALLNYLARLGWSHGDQEIFSMEEMIRLFEVTNVHTSAAAFNPEKLLWLNQHYIKTAEPKHVAHHLSHHLGKLDIDPSKGPDLIGVVTAQRERAKTLTEMAAASAFFYKTVEAYEPKDAAAHLKPEVLEPLTELRALLAVCRSGRPRRSMRRSMAWPKRADSSSANRPATARGGGRTRGVAADRPDAGAARA